ncbi:hypothetical protein MRX96_007277 [Rhipicephalus microplus]
MALLVQPPTSFNFDKVSQWLAWVQDLEEYRSASGLSERILGGPAVRTTKRPALRSTQFIEKLAGGQSTNGSTKTYESVRCVAEPVIGSHRVRRKGQSATGANDGDTSLRCAHKGKTSRIPKPVHPR